MKNKKFDDTQLKFIESLKCTNARQAKKFLKYWDDYDKEIKKKSPHCNFPKEYLPAIKHLNEIKENSSSSIKTVVTIALGIIGIVIAIMK